MKYLAMIFTTLTILSCLGFARTHSDPRVKIAVIDTGVAGDFPKAFICGGKDLTRTGLTDTHGHGTIVAELITKNLDSDKFCLIIVKFWNPGLSARVEGRNLRQALLYSIGQKVSFINLSVSGVGKNIAEERIIRLGLREGISFVVAAGNDNINLSKNCDVYPACYPFEKNFYVVAGDNISSNIGGPAKFVESGRGCYEGICMMGSSMAAAQFTNKLVRRFYETR